MTPRLRLRQAVLVARDLDTIAGQLRGALGLGEPFDDEGVGLFGLRNAVFATGDTFLEVVSPIQPGSAAGRLLDRRGVDAGGYMIMFQVSPATGGVPGVRERAARAGVRAAWEITLDDIDEVHLHPADLRGAIVAASTPEPPDSWRWGGPDWQSRLVPGPLTGAVVAVADPEAVAARWTEVLGAPPGEAGVEFLRDETEPGLVEIRLGRELPPDLEIGGVRFVSRRMA